MFFKAVLTWFLFDAIEKKTGENVIVVCLMVERMDVIITMEK